MAARARVLVLARTEFSCGFLGFSVDWSHAGQGPVYMQVSRNGLTLHLSEHHGDGSPGATAFVPMTNVEAYRAELAGKAYVYMNPGIEDRPWGRILEAIDAISNRLRFCERALDRFG